jgi:dTDP-4-dehydrorhamnose reductase
VTTWLVTGGAGQVARHLQDRLREAGIDVVAPARSELDITDRDAVDALIGATRPQVVVNAAAYTAVDAAEDDEAGADRVNHLGARWVAEAVQQHGGRLLHVSTDYVFDGSASRPYEVDDPVGPRSAYGRTKLAGEQAVLAALPDRACVVRTAWVYGGPSANFVDTMLRLERERDTLDVVADQLGSPTWAGDLAGALVELATAAPAPGVLHYVNAGQASWFDLARAVFELSGADPERVRPVDTAAFPRPAPRPAWSVLSVRAWLARGLSAPRPWRDALVDCLAARR